MPPAPQHVSRFALDAPVPDETTITDLRVTGHLPAALSGQYMRIGPNPSDTTASPAEWARGEGMVHAITLDAGRATAYRNRWITTDAVAEHFGLRPTVGPCTTGDDIV